MAEIDNRVEWLKDFGTKCKDDTGQNCQYCGKEKAFLSPLKVEDGFRLCKGCRASLLNIENYPGFTGKYFSVEPMKITFANADQGVKVTLGLSSSWL